MERTRNSIFDGSSLIKCRCRQMGAGSNSPVESLQKGSIILLVLLVSAVFAVLAPVAGTLAMSEARIARSHAVQTTALYIAEAGVELAIARLRAEPGFTGSFSGQVGGGSFAVEVSSEAPGTGETGRRRITATGRWGGGQQQAAARVTFSQAQAPLHLLEQDAQPGFRQTQAAGTVMTVTFINPQP